MSDGSRLRETATFGRHTSGNPGIAEAIQETHADIRAIGRYISDTLTKIQAYNEALGVRDYTFRGVRAVNL